MFVWPWFRKGRQKLKSCSCFVVKRENKIDKWDQFGSAFYEYFFNSICLSANCLMKRVLFSCFSYIKVSCRCLICMLCIYLLVLKSIILVQSMQDRKTQRELIIYIKCIALFCQAPSLKSANCPSPLFRQFPPIVYLNVFFVTPLPFPKKGIFQWVRIIIKFSLFNLISSFKSN